MIMMTLSLLRWLAAEDDETLDGMLNLLICTNCLIDIMCIFICSFCHPKIFFFSFAYDEMSFKISLSSGRTP